MPRNGRKVTIPFTDYAVRDARGKVAVLFLVLYASLLAPSAAQSPPVNTRPTPQSAERAQALLSLGRMQWQSGQSARALESLSVAFALSKQWNDAALEAAILTNRGQLYTITGNTKLSLADFNSALLLRQRSNNLSGEAEVLTCIGQAYIAAGLDNQALTFLDRALDLWPAINTNSGKAALLNAFGDFYNWSGDRPKALDKLQQALALAQADHNRRTEAAILNSTGEVWWALADSDKALAFYNEALPIRREVNDKAGEAVTLADIASYYSAAGDPTDSIRYNQQALALFREVGDRNDASATLNNLGAVYESIGHPEIALDDYQQALSIEREIHNTDFESTTLHAIGAMYQNIAQPRKALEFYEEALGLERRIGHMSAEAATLNNIAGVDADLEHPLAALHLYRQALELEVKLNDKRDEVITLHNIGTIYVDMKRPEQAIVYYRRALPLERSAHDQYSEAFTLWHLATLNRTNPVSGYLAALAIAQQAKNLNLQGLIETSLMETFRRENQKGLAIYFGEKAVNAYQQLRSNMEIFDDQIRSSFIKSKAETYRALAELLASQDRLVEAEQVLNLLKEAELRETVRGLPEDPASDYAALPATPADVATNSKLKSGATAALTLVDANFERSHLDKLAQTRKLSAADLAKRGELDKEIKVANAQINEFLETAILAEAGTVEEANLRISSANSHTSELVKALAKLDPGTIALYTIVGKEHSYILVISGVANPSDPEDVHGTREIHQIRTTPDNLRQIILDFHHKAETGTGELTPDLETLDHLLLDPIAADIDAAARRSKDGVPTLLWSLDDLLRYVPVSALYDSTRPTGQRYLIERARNVYVTPESIDHLPDATPTAPLHAVAFGISQGLNGMEPLDKVSDELDRVVHDPRVPASANGAIEGTIYENADFNITTLKTSLAKLPRPPVVHIASHFAFQCDPDSTTGKCTKESFLLLDGGAASGGYNLTLSQIESDLSFSGTRLVTLAACGTGEVDRWPDGREIDSLSMVVQRRFAPAVLATLWSVDDDSTAVLMGDFYHLWASGHGIQKIEALRLAQLKMLHGYSGEPEAYRGPRYWAPFVLFGNYH